MEVLVSTRNSEVPDALRSTAKDKLGRLDRFLEGMVRAEVLFSEERNPRIADNQVCEVTVEGHGHHVRCKVAAADAFAALDLAVDKLEQQLSKLKSKLSDRSRGQLRQRPPVPARALGPEGPAPGDELAGAAPAPRIVKTKRFAPMPMTADDAAQRMDLLGHGFFFFTNIDTSRAAVVYRRDDGNIGLIDEAG